ncbi:MAG: tRNA lysidine(34) synthetase TilS [Pseudomonadota bacterium]|nr:tRNA lysidine(34) synthetase TilS [Pseudomonadota bacterium]
MLDVVPQIQASARSFIQQGCQGIAVSISGGADSCALLDLLLAANLPLPLALFHVNFRLRGSESDADAEYVAKLAAKLNLPLHLHRVSASEQPPATGNTQAWAHTLRKRKAQALAAQHRYIIATAHHHDDLAESILLRLVQGKGAGQLAGMKEFKHPFWRPLLAIDRRTIRTYCQAQNIVYRNDSSNASDKYDRNRMRHYVLPQLGKINAQASRKIVALGADLQEHYEQMEADLCRRYRHQLAVQRLPAKTIKQLPSSQAKLLLYLFLGERLATRKLIIHAYRQILANKEFGIRVDAKQLLRFAAGELFFQQQTPALKIKRQQQYRRALHHEQFCAALEPQATAETESGMILTADNDAQDTLAYVLSRPSAKQRLYWQGKRCAFNEVMRTRGIGFTDSLRWYLRTSQGKQQPELIQHTNT